MDLLELAFVLAPGYLFLWFWGGLVPFKKGSDWTYIAPISFWSLVFYLTSSLLPIEYFNKFFISFRGFEELFKIKLNMHFSALTLSLLAGLILSGVVKSALIIEDHYKSKNYKGFLSILWFILMNIFAKTVISIMKFFGYLSFPDEISKFLTELLEKEVILSTKSGRFYIGILLSATNNDEEQDKAIVISPVWSGQREKNTNRVIFDTNYAAIKLSEELKLMILLDNLNSIAKFDRELNEYFIKTGKTVILEKKRRVRQKNE